MINIGLSAMNYTVYLSGEIQTAWRDEIRHSADELDLDINFVSAVLDHEASEAAGDHLGAENDLFWRDHKSAKINAIRAKTLIENCDLAVVRFDDDVRHWNAAFDAGYCAALGTPYITLHSQALIHPLKEVDAAAMAWATSTEQVVEILRYAFSE